LYGYLEMYPGMGGIGAGLKRAGWFAVMLSEGNPPSSNATDLGAARAGAIRSARWPPVVSVAERFPAAATRADKIRARQQAETEVIATNLNIMVKSPLRRGKHKLNRHIM
jgi:hypothetical protein